MLSHLLFQESYNLLFFFCSLLFFAFHFFCSGDFYMVGANGESLMPEQYINWISFFPSRIKASLHVRSVFYSSIIFDGIRGFCRYFFFLIWGFYYNKFINGFFCNYLNKHFILPILKLRHPLYWILMHIQYNVANKLFFVFFQVLIISNISTDILWRFYESLIVFNYFILYIHVAY